MPDTDQGEDTGRTVVRTIGKVVEQVIVTLLAGALLLALGWVFTPLKDVAEPTAYALGVHHLIYEDRRLEGRWAALPAGECAIALRVVPDGDAIRLTSPDGEGGATIFDARLGAMLPEQWIEVRGEEAVLQMKRRGNSLAIMVGGDSATTTEYVRCD